MFHARSIGNRLIAKIELKGGGFNDSQIESKSKLVANACHKLVTKRYYFIISAFNIFIYLFIAPGFFHDEILSSWTTIICHESRKKKKFEGRNIFTSYSRLNGCKNFSHVEYFQRRRLDENLSSRSNFSRLSVPFQTLGPILPIFLFSIRPVHRFLPSTVFSIRLVPRVYFSSLLLILLLASRFAVTPCTSRHSHLTPFSPNSPIHGGFSFSPRAAPYVVGSLECLAYTRATIQRIKRLAGPITLVYGTKGKKLLKLFLIHSHFLLDIFFQRVCHFPSFISQVRNV